MMSNYVNADKIDKNQEIWEYFDHALVDDFQAFYLKDGSCVGFSRLPVASYDYDKGDMVYYDYDLNFAEILVDVNCQNAPNKDGRDRFRFYVDKHGRLIQPTSTFCSLKYPHKRDSMLDALANELGISRKELDEMLANNNSSNLYENNLDCFYQIVSDGWKMNY